MGDGRRLGEYNHLHLVTPGGATMQLEFYPGIKLWEARDLYPGAKVRPMDAIEIAAFRAQKTKRYQQNVLKENW